MFAFDGLAAVAKDASGDIKAAAVVSRTGLDGERQRLNLTHELGHLVLTQAADVDEEKAAFRFGAAFLAPADLVRKDVGGARRRVSLGELFLLKKKYGMSVQALVYRLRDLEIINANQAAGLWREISSRGWKKKEPFALEREKPHWSRRAALGAVSEGTLTLEEAENIIGARAGEGVRTAPSERRDLMKLPLAERKRRLSIDAERAKNQYLQDDEWITLLAGDLLPDE